MQITRVALLSAAFVALALQPAWVQESDTTPPVLESLILDPNFVNVSAEARTITVTLHVKDNLSGVSADISLIVRSPSLGQGKTVRPFTLVSGTGNDGVWQASLSIPRYSEPGTWTISSLVIADRAGNRVVYNADLLGGMGLPNSFSVISDPGDLEGPKVVKVEINPASVDVSSGPQPITVRIHATDGLSGVLADWRMSVQFKSPNEIQDVSLHYGGGSNLFTLVQGTMNDGIWERTVTLPRYSEPGVWRIAQLEIRDVVENVTHLETAELQAQGLQTDLDVTSNPSDTTPPQVTAMRVSPAVVNTSLSDESVSIQFDMKDDLSGVDLSLWPGYTYIAAVRFVSPSGAQVRQVSTHNFSLVDRTRLDGTWQASLWFPRYSEPGTWKLAWVANLGDATRNRIATLQPDDLEASGFPTELIVIRPSLESDGTLIPGTSYQGRVADDIYGDAACIYDLNPAHDFDVFPSGPLDISLHVFDEPIPVPGVYAAGTKFVHVQIAPPQTYPLPPLGLSMMLPLVEPLPAYPTPAILDLKRIDPQTGALVPAKAWQVKCVSNPCGCGPSGCYGFAPVLTNARCMVIRSPEAACPRPMPRTISCGTRAVCHGVATFSTLVGVFPDEIPLTIDIKPGSGDNPINTRDLGVVPVAILGDEVFDVGLLDVTTLRFGPNGAAPAHDLTNPAVYAEHVQDVNGDGYLDLVCHFRTQDAGLNSTVTQACVSGYTYDTGNGPIPVTGCGSVRPVR